MKQISNDLGKQYELIKLIVQKMEIKTEADEWDDEDIATDLDLRTSMARVRDIGWSSRSLRNTLMQQVSVINKWKNVAEADKCASKF